MPKGKTSFQASWLDCLDANQAPVRSWCSRGKTGFEAYCSLCNSDFSISNSGKHQILAHSSNKKHIKAFNSSKNNRCITSMQINDSHTVPSGSSSNTTLTLALSNDQLITKAETIWALKVASNNYSYNSCQDLNDIFSLMFPDSAITKGFQLGEKKISYIIAYGIAPYFSSSLITEMSKNLDKTYCISFDETTTIQVKKQFDVYVRYWSSKNMVECAYLTSEFLGHATAEILKDTLLKVLEKFKLPLNKLAMLSMDGPNVNKLVHKLIDEELMSMGEKHKLINVGTCSLHKVHNAISKGLDVLNENVNIDEFATDLFAFFKTSSARREDFKELQEILEVEHHFLLRHVNSRWLSIEPVLKRIIEQYDVLKEYIINFLPKKGDKAVLATARYKRIREHLMTPSTLAYLQFAIFLCNNFIEFLTLFQSEGPLIHILFSKSNELLSNLLKKYMKPDAVNGKELEKLDIDDGSNFLPKKQMEIGAAARKTLSCLEQNKRNIILLNFRKAYIKISKYLQTELPISNQILKDLQILHPLVRESPQAINDALRRLCQYMKILDLTDCEIDKIVQEWGYYKIEDIKKEWYIESEEVINGMPKVSYQRLDLYWAKVFQIIDTDSGMPKYFNLSRLVRAYLLFFHSNADIERGFSFNNSLLRKDRINLSEKSIISNRIIKDEIRRNGNFIGNIPITSALLKSVKEARSAYHINLEKKKREIEKQLLEKKLKEKEDEEKKLLSKQEQDLQTELKLIENKRLNVQNNVKLAQQLLDEGSERLGKALVKKDIKEATIASSIIEAGKEKLDKNIKVLSEIEEEKKSLQTKLTSMKK